MKRKRFTEEQIIAALKEHEAGAAVAEISRRMGITPATLYRWKAKFGGMDASMISELKAMADENRRLKRMYAEMSMQNDLLKEALGKKR